MILSSNPLEPARVLGHDLRLERASSVARLLDPHRPVPGMHGFRGRAVAGVAGPAGRRLAVLVTEMVGQLGRHRPLNKTLGQPLQQAVGAGDLLRRTGAGEQLVDQLVRRVRTIKLRGDECHRLLRVVLGHGLVSFPSRPAQLRPRLHRESDRPSAEAIRLGRFLIELMPDEAEAHGLLALMLINHARTTARFRDGELVLLDDQDRSLWDEHQIGEGRELLERALALHGSGPYVIQAAIAGLHLREPREWEEIALLYEQLEQITRSPVVAMNRAIAVAELEGPHRALELLDELDLDDYRYYHSTRADLLRRLGRDDDARAAYARALELTEPGPESRFLESRLADLPRGADEAL